MANPLQTANNQIQAKCVELGDKASFRINTLGLEPKKALIIEAGPVGLTTNLTIFWIQVACFFLHTAHV